MSLGQKRGYHICGVIVWVALVCGLILSQGSPKLMYRNLVNCKSFAREFPFALSHSLAPSRLVPCVLAHDELLEGKV